MDKIKPDFDDPPGYTNRLIGHERPIIHLSFKLLKVDEEE